MKEKIQYLGRAMFHPFDAFYEIKYRGKGSVLIAVIIFALYCIENCIAYQYNGFIINKHLIQYMNSFKIIIASMSIPLLLMIGNWSVTTLFNGKGSFKDIFTVVCYSAVPYIVVKLLCIFISNFIISEEVIILNAVEIIAVVWFAFLMFSGLCVVHEYGAAKNIITLIATAIAACIIIFLIVLFISLLEQMISFFTTAGEELLRRI